MTVDDGSTTVRPVLEVMRGSRGVSPARRLARRWPSLVALAFAVLVGAGLSDGVDLAPVLAASAVVYLGSAALGRRSAAWPVFFVTVVVLVAVQVLGLDRAATAVVLGVGVLLAAWSVLRRRTVADTARRAQVLGFLGFGAASLLALWLRPDLGAFLVAAGLLGHAAWDVVHHRWRTVVAPSMSKFCCVLDVALAVAILVAVSRS